LTSVKDRLRELLDIKDEWVLAALYSDPQVRRINERLVERWRSSGMRGDPLDYATDEEARILLALAQRYVYLTPDQARAIALGRGAGGSSQREGEKTGLWSSLIGGLRRRVKRAS